MRRLGKAGMPIPRKLTLWPSIGIVLLQSMGRAVHESVQFCEGLGVNFPGPLRKRRSICLSPGTHSRPRVNRLSITAYCKSSSVIAAVI